MSEKVRCPKCGHTKFSVFHRPARAASRFLFWKTEAHPEAMELWCLGCGFEDFRPDLVGCIRSSSLEVETP